MQIQNPPQVQIVMAVYNGSLYLKEQIESIINQDYKNWQLLISDDNSNDDSVEIINRYAAKDNRIKVVLKDSAFGNAGTHFLSLLKITTSKYVMCSDQDDVWDSNKITTCLSAMIQEEAMSPDTPILIHTDLRVVDSKLNRIADSFYEYSGINPNTSTFEFHIATANVTGCTMLINDSLRDLIKLTNDDRYICMHDWWCSLIASAFGRIGFIDNQTICYRQHENNTLGAQEKSLWNSIHQIKKLKADTIKTIEQAESFKEVYGSMLSKKQITHLDSYIQLKSCNTIQVPINLNKARVWRHDLRGNLGLLVTFILISVTGSEIDS